MANTVIQAVAGAGKTYSITHQMMNLDKRYLLITYTNGNVKNLQDGVLDSGFPIEQYQVMTFSKFMIDWLVKPFLPIMQPSLNTNFFGNFTPKEPPKNGKAYNPAYVNKDEAGHYIDLNGSFYLSRISGYVMEQASNISSENDYWTYVWKRMGKYIDEVFIDEYQDLTGKDFDIIKKMMKQKYFKVTLVGDIYQSDVIRSMQRSAPKLNVEDGKITEGLQKNFGKKIHIDLESLKYSRRISPKAAKLVKTKLNIEIESQQQSSGEIILLSDVDSIIKELISQTSVLIWNVRGEIPPFINYRTWSYSKGDTFDRVLVVLTSSTNNILDDEFITPENSVRNKLYVALTRSKGDLLLVKSDTWKQVIKKIETEKIIQF